VVITAYSLLSRDREMWLQVPWHLLVLDEAQNIKNANTNAAQVVSEIPALHRLCLSGTPIENHLGELWSQFHFLMPGFLGSQKRFTELFRNPIERQGSAGGMVDPLQRSGSRLGVSRFPQSPGPPHTGVIAGAISGRALYDGAIDLADALRALRA
jgi:SNF2 family DNA or RNA helicase